MITKISGGVFELQTGRPWTWGISPFREGEALKLKREESGRWFFEINEVQYSAKQIAPHLKDIQIHS